VISERRPHKITPYSVLCKRNVVFFLQQFDDAQHPMTLRTLDSAAVTTSSRYINRYCWYRAVTIAAMIVLGPVGAACAESKVCASGEPDRVWLISTRGLTRNVCCADLSQPSFAVYRVKSCGALRDATVDEYFAMVGPDRPVVFYIHGNRMEADHASCHGLAIYRRCRGCLRSGPIDWVIWSWPSEQVGVLAHDVRVKAARTDLQGLYLAWLLREHVNRSTRATVIGYSFGGRIATGALHALAGGALSSRRLGGQEITGKHFGAGLIAPAIERNWLSYHGYHRRATKNLERMVLLYNRRDIVLKRYWLIDKVRGRMALGYSGPTMFAKRADGSPLPVQSRDCSTSIGFKHVELEYFSTTCRAGATLASLIDDIQLSL